MQGYGEIRPLTYGGLEDPFERFRLGVRVTEAKRKDFGVAGVVYFVRLVVLDRPDINTGNEFKPRTQVSDELLVANPRTIKMEPNVGDELDIILLRRKSDYVCVVSRAAHLQTS